MRLVVKRGKGRGNLSGSIILEIKLAASEISTPLKKKKRGPETRKGVRYQGMVGEYGVVHA